MQKGNDIARWIIVGLSVIMVIFNTGVVYNDVKHNTEAIEKIRQDIKEIRNYLLESK